MCFSAESSLAAGVALIPAGVYCFTAAGRKDRAYLPLAALPFLFGVQQLCEAAVWHGLEHRSPRLVEYSSLAFLFFGMAFWPAWVPFAAAALEGRPGRRILFLGMAGVGLVLGGVAYLPAAMHYGDWLEVRVVGHSIRYDFARFPAANSAAGTLWQVVYLAVVCVPLLTSQDRSVRLFGGSIAVSAVVTHVVFWYAILSVWCFFAAILSAHVCYVLYRLPSDRRVAVSLTPPRRTDPALLS